MANTALLLVDPYNEFFHKDGKMYSSLADAYARFDTIPHVFEAVHVARKAKIPVFYSLHHQFVARDYIGWQHMTAMQHAGRNIKFAEEGSFGAQIFSGLEPDPENGDTVFAKHWNSSGFYNTDLDYILRQREITKLVFVGVTANSCLEGTARSAYELAYHITMLKDATAGFTIEQTEAAVNIVWPLFSNQVITTKEWVDSLTK